MSPKTDLSNVDVVLYALYKLGGPSKKIHTECVAIEAYKLSEERFSWTLPVYRKLGYPDKTTVRYSLESAKKEKLVNGRGGRDKGGSQSEGWQFTPEGVQWFLDNEKRISSGLKISQPLSTEIPKHQAERFIKKIKTERIFKIYLSKASLNEATSYDFTDMLSCSPDASKNIIRQKFDLIKSTAFSINDDEIKKFLLKCEEKFIDLLVS
jgi:hypothetical protein